ncbi:MAG: DNA replication and repair protein RecF [Bacteroidaceae bacterium]|nr:DNA replication and repair protein RecF [Bacteroidaceae bacterium]
MILRRLSVLNYRNIAEAELTFSEGVNCLTGANGQGKTNLLDAVYFLSFCKSSGGAPDALNMRHGEDFFMLTGHYLSDSGTEEKVSCGARRGQRKHLRRNDKEYSRLADHVGAIPLVMISPGDQELVSGQSDARRRFMNAVIAQYDAAYLAAAMRYERTLKQRNALLREDTPVDAGVMDVLEQMLSADAEVLYAARRAFVNEFTPFFADTYGRLCPDADELPAIAFSSHFERGSLAALLADYRERERIVGHTLHGPHRDDLLLTLGGYPVRHEGSQGQTKTFFIALKLAQYAFLRTKGERRTPLLLLDDIFDKLDTQRVERIVRFVSGGMPGQVFITDTDRSHVNRILADTKGDYRHFHVERGAITAL